MSRRAPLEFILLTVSLTVATAVLGVAPAAAESDGPVTTPAPADRLQQSQEVPVRVCRRRFL